MPPPGLFDGTPLQRPVTCPACELPLTACACGRDAKGTLTPPSLQAARVRREKRSGKVVCVIAGLDPVATDLPAMLKRFRTALGTGGTHDKQRGTLELQGDHRDRLVAELIKLGYPAKAAGG